MAEEEKSVVALITFADDGSMVVTTANPTTAFTAADVRALTNQLERGEGGNVYSRAR